MTALRVQLTEEQARKLKRLASERGVSISALIREAVDRLDDELSMDEKWERALAVVGKYRDGSGARDVAVNHDRYLEDAYLDWRR
jgi:hypothetical protein